ncbi:hypothetical protein C8J57DRAFT_1231583 [Mycena rebaudengoi]|nr:hypothetical protein C8J57DRAFT_1231583 [Mycena rebaudengoi]
MDGSWEPSSAYANLLTEPFIRTRAREVGLGLCSCIVVRWLSVAVSCQVSARLTPSSLSGDTQLTSQWTREKKHVEGARPRSRREQLESYAQKKPSVGSTQVVEEGDLSNNTELDAPAPERMEVLTVTGYVDSAPLLGQKMSSAVARGDAESADNREVFDKINV